MLVLTPVSGQAMQEARERGIPRRGDARLMGNGGSGFVGVD